MKPFQKRIRIVQLAVASFAVATLLGAGAASAENFRLSTLGPGTSPYVVMTTFANIVNDKVPGAQVQVNATGAATRHVVETAMGRSEFAMMSPSMVPMMQNNVGPYKRVPQAPELIKELRLVLNFPLGYYHIITFADSGITRLKQIKGKRVFLGPPGGAGTLIAARLIKGLTGYEAGKDYDTADLGWDAAAQSFQDGHIDVYVNPTLAPSPVIQQIAMLKRIRLLGMPDPLPPNEDLHELINRPGGQVGTIPAGVYGEGQVNQEDVRTIMSIGGIVTRANIPEETIYRMTKAFWENLDSRKGRVPVLKNIALENALQEANLPLHPGALRYYREVGLEIPRELVPK
ncbi:MAG TPA: TAXI family TRAP transporter solute-binding subunit [Burkholderiales bacterium]